MTSDMTSDHPYVVVVHWHPRSPHEQSPASTTETYASLDEAELAGKHSGCLRGVRRVEVYGPDGNLCALGDKESNHATLTPWYFEDETGEVLWDRSYLRNRWQRFTPADHPPTSCPHCGILLKPDPLTEPTPRAENEKS